MRVQLCLLIVEVQRKCSKVCRLVLGCLGKMLCSMCMPMHMPMSMLTRQFIQQLATQSALLHVTGI